MFWLHIRTAVKQSIEYPIKRKLGLSVFWHVQIDCSRVLSLITSSRITLITANNNDIDSRYSFVKVTTRRGYCQTLSLSPNFERAIRMYRTQFNDEKQDGLAAIQTRGLQFTSPADYYSGSLMPTTDLTNPIK